MKILFAKNKKNNKQLQIIVLSIVMISVTILFGAVDLKLPKKKKKKKKGRFEMNGER